MSDAARPHIHVFQNVVKKTSLQWRHNEHDSVSNHQPHVCLLNRLFGRRTKKTSKLRVTGLWVGNSPRTGEFTAQMASNAENVSIWCRHHVLFSVVTSSVVLVRNDEGKLTKQQDFVYFFICRVQPGPQNSAYIFNILRETKQLTRLARISYVLQNILLKRHSELYKHA